MAKKIIISVINDLATDQRVHRSAFTFHEMGFDVLLLGRQLPGSLPLSRPYQTKRFTLLFNKGPLFYINYNLRLIFFLFFKKTDLLFSNDLDTLLANYIVAKFKKLPLYYDSHEYFTGVPELKDRHFKRNTWKWLEKKMIPGVTSMFTVNESIATLYKKEYGVDVKVMRNVPELNNTFIDKKTLRESLNLPADKNIFILQGSGINIQRGAEEAVEAMQYIDGILLIVGDGDVLNVLKVTVHNRNLHKKVVFIPKQQHHELKKYTMAANIGLTLDKDLSINYRFSLPNKLFDYIHAGLPVLASDLPEVRKIVEQYNIGMITNSHDPEKLASILTQMTSNKAQMESWKQNALNASKELCWDKEKEVLIDAFRSLNLY